MPKPSPAFEGADLYSSDDAEDLNCDTPEEYILERVESHGEIKLPITTQDEKEHFLDVIGEMEVFAYYRKELDDAVILSHTIWGVERILEGLGEEYGPPDESILTDKEETALVEQVMPLVRDALKKKGIWQCERGGSRLYTAEEVYAICKEGITDFEAFVGG